MGGSIITNGRYNVSSLALGIYPLALDFNNTFQLNFGLELNYNYNESSSTDFEGYDGNSWQSLTSGGAASVWSVNGTDIYNDALGVKVGSNSIMDLIKQIFLL